MPLIQSILHHSGYPFHGCTDKMTNWNVLNAWDVIVIVIVKHPISFKDIFFSLKSLSKFISYIQGCLDLKDSVCTSSIT